MIDGGLVILSRYPIIETEFQGFYNGLGPDLFSFKGVLYTKLNVQGETIHVFSAHTQASYHTDDPRLFNYYRMVRRSQFRMMRDFIERKTQESQDLILVMGDMNVDGREKLKKPLFQETECQDDYEIMIESLSNKDNIVDLIRSKYGFSPCTFGKTLANGEPEETILSHIDENNKELALDYILAINLDKAAFGHYIEDTNTEPFYVKDKPFTRLSDHYGVQTSLYVKTESKSQ